MILGVDCIKQFSPMISGLVQATIKFNYGDLLIIFKGDDTCGKLTTNIKEATAQKWVKQEHNIEGGQFF